jgi:hypothetical protein
MVVLLLVLSSGLLIFVGSSAVSSLCWFGSQLSCCNCCQYWYCHHYCPTGIVVGFGVNI